MSDHSDFSLCVIDKRDLSNFFGVEIATILAGEPIAIDSKYLHFYKPLRREMRGFTRGDWFKVSMRELLDISGIENLRFLSQETHKYRHISVDDSHQHEYTVIKRDDFELILNALDALVIWCRDNPNKADAVLVLDYPESATESIENAFYTSNPNRDDCGDEGRGSLFFFCVLKTVGDMLRYANHQGFWAIYDNEYMVYETDLARASGS
jgi:hypothetical protein